jgi:ABC-type transport system substrate-binding protein
VDLVSDTKFHDGTPLSAGIVTDALKSTLPTFMGSAFADVESVSAPNAHQVVLRLTRASPFLLDTLEASIPKPGFPLVGTGPFSVAGDKSPTELRANNDYRLGKPAIQRISVETFPSVRAAWAEMLRGRLDMLYEVAPDALDSLQASSNIATFSFTRRFQYLIVLNTNTDPLRSAAIRQALNMAIDRPALVRDALGDHGLPSSGPVWPRNYAFRSDPNRAKYDVAAAAKTLTSGSTTLPNAKLRFTCLVLKGADFERIALVVKRQLAAVGVDMSVKEVEMKAVSEALKNRNFEAVLTEMISGSGLRLYRIWHSGGVAGATSASVDAALDRMRYAPSDDEYMDSIAAFQQAAVNDPPAIFLAWMERVRAVSRRFVVPAAEPGRDIMSNLRLWKPTAVPERGSPN